MGYWGRSWVYVPQRRAGRRSEIVDLLVSWAAITLAFSADYLMRGYFIGVGIAGIAVGTGFVFHELAHRQVALRYGLFARYRAWYTGLLVAVAIAFATAAAFGKSFVIAAPGAVYIVGAMGFIHPAVELRIAEAGPAANIAVSLSFLILSYFVGYPWRLYFAIISSVNAVLAFFNLLPFPPLDGYKIMRVSPVEWGALFAAAFVLTFLI